MSEKDPTIQTRLRKHNEKRRKQGWRYIQVWVPSEAEAVELKRIASDMRNGKYYYHETKVNYAIPVIPLSEPAPVPHFDIKQVDYPESNREKRLQKYYLSVKYGKFDENGNPFTWWEQPEFDSREAVFAAISSLMDDKKFQYTHVMHNDTILGTFFSPWW